MLKSAPSSPTASSPASAVQYVGEVGGSERNRLMGDAVALLNPISWPEPFGLTVIEANACGTPVVSFEAGASLETVKHGTSGWLVHDIASAVEAVHRIGAIERASCRRWVEERFSCSRMVLQYLDVYAAAVKGPSDVAGRVRPRVLDARNEEAAWS